MKLFAKLNLKKVHQAYLDVTALNFLTEVVCVACDNARHTADKVSVSETINLAAQINANAISTMTGGSGLDYSTGISRLHEVADSFLRRFRSELGSEAEVTELIGKCYELFYQVSEYIGQAIHKGYLDFSFTDYQTLVSSNEDRMERAMKGTVARGDEFMESLQNEIHSYRSDQEKSDAPQNTQAKRPVAIKEKIDRAVHGRAPVESMSAEIENDLARSPKVTEERYSLPFKITEAFDLISPSGAIQADIEVQISGGRSHKLFCANDRPPQTNFAVIPTIEDNQSTMHFELVAKIGSSTNTIGKYDVTRIRKAHSGATQIRLEIKIQSTTLTVLVAENFLDSKIRVEKVA